MERESSVAANEWFFPSLIPLHYELIVIDPPWDYVLRSAKGEKKSFKLHYKAMPDHEILALPVGQLASFNCLLYCWTTAPRLPFALDCVKAWGFEYKSFLIWRKVTKNAKVRMGTGYRVRTTGEIVIVATLGNPKQAIAPQTILDGVARENSRKPEEFYELCDRVMPFARRADVFARQQRPGWHSFGDEVTKFNTGVVA
jgi:N6-adenosine-specific RNA methylase IME4